MRTGTLVSIFVFVNVCVCLKLPSGFKKCDKRNDGFDKCLSNAIQNAIEQLTKPLPEYGLPSLEPFLLPRTLKAGNSSNGIEQKYSNIKFGGLTNVTNTKAKMDFDNNVMFVEITLYNFAFEADYEITGNLIIFPLATTGHINASYPNTVNSLTFYLEKYQKENQYYYKILTTDFDIKVERGYFNYENLFENKDFNEAYNQLLNENWSKVFDYIRNKYGGVMAAFYGGLFGNVLEKVPIADLFDGVI